MQCLNRIALGIASLALTSAAFAQDAKPTPVTVQNFPRAESDLYMGRTAKDGGLGKFVHNRTPTEIDNQKVIRMNRDTLYSSAVFDLDAGPVTITLPATGKRFMSLQVINEDHYTPMVVYAPATVKLTKANVGTRYVMTPVRTLVDPADPNDLKAVHAAQDAIKVTQASIGTFDAPNWDQAAQNKIRDALLVLASMNEGFGNSFGVKGQVDPIRHLISTAAGWGGNPDKDARYSSFTPVKNDGTTIYRLKVPGNVPVDAFWSISVYNAAGFFEKNPYNAYSLNNLTAKKSPDGSVDVQFGGCDGKIPNCLPASKGWNYTVRMYRPRKDILDGSWKFPEAKPVT